MAKVWILGGILAIVVVLAAGCSCGCKSKTACPVNPPVARVPLVAF